MTIVTDPVYVLKGMAKISSGRLPTTNLDLWLQVKQVLARYPQNVQVVKIESHMTVEQAKLSNTNVEHYLVNALSDEAAGYWAQKCAVSSDIVAAVEHAEASGRAVRKHLAKAFLSAAEAEPRRLRPTRSMAKKFCRKVAMSEHQ
eukprot:9166045-Pyramimonas_sp.AAC.1